MNKKIQLNVCQRVVGAEETELSGELEEET